MIDLLDWPGSPIAPDRVITPDFHLPMTGLSGTRASTPAMVTSLPPS